MKKLKVGMKIRIIDKQFEDKNFHQYGYPLTNLPKEEFNNLIGTIISFPFTRENPKVMTEKGECIVDIRDDKIEIIEEEVTNMNLTCDDYYDSGTVYEEEMSFAQIIEELNDSEYSKSDIKKILMGLVNDLISDYIER